jgi:hypothetical protein
MLLGCVVGSDRVHHRGHHIASDKWECWAKQRRFLYFGGLGCHVVFLAPCGSQSPRRAEDVVISDTASAWRVTLAFDDFSEITTRERTGQQAPIRAIHGLAKIMRSP